MIESEFTAVELLLFELFSIELFFIFSCEFLRVSDFSFVGARSIIKSGSNIGARAFIESFSLVEQSVRSGSIVSGTDIRSIQTSPQSGKQFKSRSNFEIISQPFNILLIWFLILFPYGLLEWLLIEQLNFSIYLYLLLLPIFYIPNNLFSLFILSQISLWIYYRKHSKFHYFNGKQCRIGTYSFYQLVWLNQMILYFISILLFPFSNTKIITTILHLFGLKLNISSNSTILFENGWNFQLPLSMIQFKQKQK